MTDVANLTIQVNSRGVRRATTDLDRMDSNGQDAERTTNRLSQSFNKLALAASVAGLAIGVSLFRSSIKNTIEQERVVAQLNQTLKSTDRFTQETSSSLQNLASELQNVSTFGDEAVIASTSLLLTFTNLGLKTLPRAQKAVLDVATALGTDLKSASLQVGKALNDPATGLSALSRSGITFSDSQKEVIKNLAEVGDMAGAQALILKELEVQFGGSAKAAKETLGGSLQSLSNAFGDLLEAKSGSPSALTASINQLTGTLNSPEIKQGFQNIVTGFLSIGNALVKATVVINENLDLLAKIAGATALIIGGRFAGSLATSTAAMFAATAQSIRYQATLASMAGVSRVAAASQVALASAARLSTAAMGFLGGPAGIALIAAGSLLFFATRAREATKSTDELSQSIDTLTVEGATKRLSELSKSLAESTKEQAKLTRLVGLGGRNTAGIGSFGATKPLQELESDLASASKKVTQLKELQTELLKITNDKDRPATLKALAAAQVASDELIVASAAKKNAQLIALKNAQDKLLTQSASFLQSIKSPLELFKDQEALLLKFSKTVNDATGKKLITDDQLQEGIRRARVEMEALIASASLEEPIVKFKEFNQEASASESLIKSLQTASEGFSESFANALVDGGTSFENFANGILKQLQKIALQKAFAPIFGGFSDKLGELFPDAATLAANFIGPRRQTDYQGGGFTGSGPRSGGVDGRGGFNAILHPNETVIDHTKGQSMGGNMSVVVNVDASGSSSSGDADGQNLGNLIGIAVRSVLIEESRPGGILA